MRGEDVAVVIGGFIAFLFLGGLWLLPVILGVRAAKTKGYSPHWMWFGLHPVGAWVAFIVIACLSQRARCPACTQYVSAKYSICPYCRVSLVRTGGVPPREPFSQNATPASRDSKSSWPTE